MEELIQQAIKYSEKIPLEYRSTTFPLILEHLLLIDRQKYRTANPYQPRKTAWFTYQQVIYWKKNTNKLL